MNLKLKIRENFAHSNFLIKIAHIKSKNIFKHIENSVTGYLSILTKIIEKFPRNLILTKFLVAGLLFNWILND